MPKQAAKAKKQAPPTSKDSQPSWQIRVLITVLAAFCLIISDSAIWFKRYIFTTGTFTNLATQSLLSESSRQATATEITDSLLEKRPVLKATIDDRVEKVVAALLDTDLSKRAVEKSVTVLHTAVTSKDPQPVTIDLSGIKGTVTNFLTVLRQQTNRSPDQYRVDPADIPDQVVLFDPSKLPNIYTIGVVMMWLGPLTLFLALGSLGYLIYRARKSKLWLKQIFALEGGILVFGGILALLIGPLFRPPVLAQITSPNTRIVVENVYDSFLDKFNQQASFFFLLGAVLLGAALWLHVAPYFTRKKT